MLVQEPPRTLPRQAPLGTSGTPAWRAFVLLAGVLLLGGCASVADVTGTATQDDVVQIRADIAALQRSVQQAKTLAESIPAQVDARLREQAAERDRQGTALTRRLDGLTTSLSGLTARVDELANRVDALSRQARAGAPAPRTPPASPVPSGQAPAGAPAAGTPPAPAPTIARPSTGSPQPQDFYQAAYIDFSKGSYLLAITGFREFLRRFPDHPLAANAQYWIGEAHLALARSYANQSQAERANLALDQAVREFRKVIANYPRAEKAPAALYKEALALIELKQPALAQARLQYLVENFPQAEETPLARERLASLKDR